MGTAFAQATCCDRVCRDRGKGCVSQALGTLVESIGYHRSRRGVRIGGRSTVDMGRELPGVFGQGQGKLGYLSCVGILGE